MDDFFKRLVRAVVHLSLVRDEFVTARDGHIDAAAIWISFLMRVIRLLDGSAGLLERLTADKTSLSIFTADEIFGGPQPVLRTVEPHSRCWRGARLAPSRDGQEWAAEFRQLPAAEPVRRDGGQGLAKGVARVSAERQAAGQEPRAAPGDHFHILQRGQRALHAVRRQVTRALGAADKAQQPIGRDRQAGVPLAGAVVGAANRRWQEAEAACDRWAAPDAAWRRSSGASTS